MASLPETAISLRTEALNSALCACAPNVNRTNAARNSNPFFIDYNFSCVGPSASGPAHFSLKVNVCGRISKRYLFQETRTEQAEPRRSVPQEKTPDFRSGVQAQFLKGQRRIMNVQRLKPTDNELRNQRVIQGHSAGYGAILLLLRRLHLFLGRRFLAHDRRSGRLFSRLDLSSPVRDRSDDHPADHRNLLDFRQILPADHGLRGRQSSRSSSVRRSFRTRRTPSTSWRDMSSRDSG